MTLIGQPNTTNEAYTVKDNDVDKNVYGVVRTGALYWLRENLRATHYNDGTPIANAATTSVTAYDLSNQPTGVEPRVFHDKAAYIAPESGSAEDIQKYGYLYNFRAASGADKDGDYWCMEVETAYDLMGGKMPSSCLSQQGVPAFPSDKTNKSICPKGWRIPHIFYQPYQMWSYLVCDVDIIENWLASSRWLYFMSEDQHLPGTEVPDPNNYSGFSLNVCKAYGQAEGTFELGDSDKYFGIPALPHKYIIPFWTANLSQCNNLLYPAPGVLLTDDDNDVFYQFRTNNYKNQDFLELIGKNYYPIRCMRIEE